MNSLESLHSRGQSLWLDSISRGLITRGELARLIQQDGLRGLTSNPCIFEKAIANGVDYEDLLQSPELHGVEAQALYERLVVRDIQGAADLLAPVYHASRWRDGYASLEVSPRLAHDTQGTLGEARRLWQMAGRENLMIKVPATPEGLAAVPELIGAGINVNITLLFAPETYVQAAEAWFSGLELLAQRGGQLGKAASVASFFVSRIDTAVDHAIAARLRAFPGPAEQDLLRSLLGKAAIATAKSTYQRYLGIHRGARWLELRRLGAQSQRLLWASTGTKNPDYSDVLYVEELVGPDTVTTLSPATLEAFRDHGRVRTTLTEEVQEAASVLDLVAQAGIPIHEIAAHLLAEGLSQFQEAFSSILRTVHGACRGCNSDPMELARLRLLKELCKE